MPKNLMYVDFKAKKKTLAFSVNPEMDKNVIFKKTLKELEQFYRDEKWKNPPGPDCYSEQEIRNLSFFRGDFFLSKKGKALWKIVEHTQLCDRCDAVWFRYLLDQKKNDIKNRKD